MSNKILESAIRKMNYAPLFANFYGYLTPAEIFALVKKGVKFDKHTLDFAEREKKSGKSGGINCCVKHLNGLKKGAP